jgi:DNA-binding protein YbaB
MWMVAEAGRAAQMSRAWDAVLHDVDEQRAQLRALERELSDATVEATSTDRLVSVVINARGMLTDLRIEPLALRRYRAEQLSGLICELVERADNEIAARRNQLTAAIVESSGPDFRDLD